LLKEVGLDLPPIEAKSLFKTLDNDDTGKLSHEEVLLLYKKMSSID